MIWKGSFTLYRHILPIRNSDNFLIGLNWYIETVVLLQIRQCTHLRATALSRLAWKISLSGKFLFFLTLLLRFSSILPNRVSVNQDDRYKKIGFVVSHRLKGCLRICACVCTNLETYVLGLSDDSLFPGHSQPLIINSNGKAAVHHVQRQRARQRQRQRQRHRQRKG